MMFEVVLDSLLAVRMNATATDGSVARRGQNTALTPMSYESLITTIVEVDADSRMGASAAVSRHHTLRNWLIGAHIVEFEQNGADRASYGQQLLSRVSRDLRQRNVPGCSPEMLGRMRVFYRTDPQLGSSMSLPSAPNLSASPAWNGLPEIPSPVTESAPSYPTPLDGHLLLQLPWSHLIELIRLDDPWKRAFYENECLTSSWSLLRCHLLIELKVRQFQHGDAGQMNFYLNYWKREMTGPTDAPPVGLLLCSDKDQTKVEYATGGLDQQLFVSRYLVALPKPTDIEQLIERDRALWEQRRATGIAPMPT